MEATSAPRADRVASEDLRALLDILDADPAALQCDDRCVVQLRISATTQADALFTTLSRWDDAFARMNVPPWEVVRVEVLTLEEFQHDFENEQLSSTLRELGLRVGHEPPDERAEELIHRAFSDPLTGLKNEAAFRDRMERVLCRAGGRSTTALLCLDLDDFQSLNGRFGRTVGDRVLVVVGERLRAALRPKDVLARRGGDQFGILVEDTHRVQAEALVERLLAVVAEPVVLGELALTVTATVGIALSGPGVSAERLLERALFALDVARDCEGGSLAVFGPEHPDEETSHVAAPADAVQDQLAYLTLLNQAAVAANESTTLEEAAEAVLQQVCRFTGCASGRLYVTPPGEPDLLVPTAVSLQGTPGGHDAIQHAAARVGLPDLVLATRRPAWVPDLTLVADKVETEEAVAAGLRAAFALPILVRTEVVGVLEFLCTEPMEATGSFLDLLANIGTQLGRVVERRRAQEALQESELMLREAQSLGRLGSWHTDLLRGRTTWSDELYEILGLSPWETPPTLESLLAVVHPEDRPLVEDDARSSELEHDENPLEFRLLRPDGEFRWVLRRRSCVRDAAGDVVALHMTIQDITDHKRVAQCAFTCEARWHIMLQASQEVLSLLTEDGKVFFSLAPAGTVVLNPDEGCPTFLADAVHPDDADVVRAVLAALFANPDECVAFEARFRGEGGWYWHSSIATNLLDEPLVGAIVLNSHDLSAHEQLQESLTEPSAR